MAQMDHTSLFLTVMVLFTAATKHHMTVREGDEVTLSCENVVDDQHECKHTYWIFRGSKNTVTAELVKLGRICENAKSKSDRLSFTGNCSVVIKNVTDVDVGLYGCRRFDKFRKKQGNDTVFYLSMVKLTEHKNDSMVTLNCSVSTRGRCGHTVKWLYQGQDVDEDHNELRTSRSGCWATVTFLESQSIYAPENLELLGCDITHALSENVQLFPFRPPSSRESADEETATTARSAINDTSPNRQDWWWLYLWVVAVGLVGLLSTVGAVIKWQRTKRNKSQMDHNAVSLHQLNLSPAGTPSAPKTSRVTADPEGGVSYASISHAKKANREARFRFDDDDDEDDAGRYSKVKASSCSAGASAYPSDLYANVN
ncbi:uncharacterized protein LOC120788684 isoform X2 [Xiphias gladius]|uniref:uncharacterized protein LOC120788684 isoform X2 n=1 Tax=Xiphias gladius TaxID=8245 RepID=UPI001A9A194D|nr:uncharacterized protein LOC120788684 isoform X2 [Xiphias gladius]